MIYVQNCSQYFFSFDSYLTEAKQKYISSYIEGSVGRIAWKPALESRKNLPTENATIEAGPLSPTLGSSLPGPPLSQEETSILGYMINRDDFERVTFY